MTVREFNGSTDVLTWNVGGLTGQTFGTYALVVKIDSAGTFRTYYCYTSSAGAFIFTPFQVTSAGALEWSGLATGITPATGVWLTIIGRKTTGTTTPRISIRNHNTGAWSHANASGGTIANHTALAATDRYAFGTDGSGAEGADGRVAVIGGWNNSLPWSPDAAGDAALEAAGLDTLQGWLNYTPSTLIRLNQPAVTDNIVDLTAGGSAQTSRTGTTVVTTDDPPMFSFALAGPVAERRPLPGRIGPDRRVYVPGWPRSTETPVAAGLQQINVGGTVTPTGALVKADSMVRFGYVGPNWLAVTDFGANFSTPDHADFALGTELAIRMKIRMITWKPSGISSHQLGQASGSDVGNYSWVYSIHPDGRPRLAVYPTGFNASLIGMPADAAFFDVGAQNGQWFCIGVKVELNVGGAGTTRRFTYEYSADNGDTWQTLGTPQSEAGATSFFNSTLVVGSSGIVASQANAYEWIKIWSDIARTNLIGSPNFGDLAPGATSHVDSTGKTWTHGAFSALTEGGGLTGALVKDDQKQLAGTVAPTGVLATVRAVLKDFAGQVTPTGALAKLAAKVLAGAATPTGTVAKTDQKNLAGTVTPAGTLVRQAAKVLAGAITPSGTLTSIKIAVKALAGAITPTGALAKLTSHLTAGGTTPAGQVTKTTQKPLSGALGPTGGLVKAAAKLLAGAVTPTGTLANVKVAIKAFAGAVTPTGALVKQDQKNLAGSVTPAGSLTRQLALKLFLVGAVTPAGALRKAVAKVLAGATTPAGAVAFLKVLLRSYAGAVTPTGALAKADTKPVAGAVTPTGTERATVAKALAGQVAPPGDLRKAVARTLAGSLATSGVLAAARVIIRLFGGSITPSGTVTTSTGPAGPVSAGEDDETQLTTIDAGAGLTTDNGGHQLAAADTGTRLRGRRTDEWVLTIRED